jgi:hypothetical protein
MLKGQTQRIKRADFSYKNAKYRLNFPAGILLFLRELVVLEASISSIA